MQGLLISFAGLLLLGVLVSERAHRTVLSTAVLFLLGGFVLGPGVAGVIQVQAGDPIVTGLSELALFAVLFTDGLKVGIGELRSAWRLPGRALLFGMPLTFLATALLAQLFLDLSWPQAFLLAAVLAPTDPVFAAAIVGREEVPLRLRRLLNVESGVNDGLALPLVIVALAVVGGTEASGWTLVSELALGIGIGVVVPWLVLRLERLPALAATEAFQPLVTVSIAIAVLAACLATHGNLFLGAFTAGVTVASAEPRFREEFEPFGELVTELLKLAAILVFGALITPTFLFEEIPALGWVFAVAALLLARPAALAVAFLGARLSWREQAVAMWFGPKGFASVVYGLLVLHSGASGSDLVFHLVALVVVLSILAHSSTDVLLARAFRGRPDTWDEPADAEPPDEEGVPARRR